MDWVWLPIFVAAVPCYKGKGELVSAHETVSTYVPWRGGEPIDVAQVFHFSLVHLAILDGIEAFLDALVSLLEVVLKIFCFQDHIDV